MLLDTGIPRVRSRREEGGSVGSESVCKRLLPFRRVVSVSKALDPGGPRKCGSRERRQSPV